MSHRRLEVCRKGMIGVRQKPLPAIVVAQPCECCQGLTVGDMRGIVQRHDPMERSLRPESTQGYCSKRGQFGICQTNMHQRFEVLNAAQTNRLQSNHLVFHTLTGKAFTNGLPGKKPGESVDNLTSLSIRQRLDKMHSTPDRIDWIPLLHRSKPAR